MQIFGNYRGRGYLSENEPEIEFEAKSCEIKNHIEYYSLVNIGSGFRETYQIDPLLAFCQGVDFINRLVTNSLFVNNTFAQFENELHAQFYGKAYLIYEEYIGDTLLDFSVNILPKNENGLASFPVKVEISGIMDEIFYTFDPMKSFKLGCDIISSKLCYFNKYL